MRERPGDGRVRGHFADGAEGRVGRRSDESIRDERAEGSSLV